MTPLMVENWRDIPDFPGYSVSDLGRVRNDVRDRILAQLVGPRVTYVGLSRNLVQHSRSVPLLVAEAWLPRPSLAEQRRTFDTPINLDGDRTHNAVTNLMWRPRWFAAKYHQQFRKEWAPRPVQDLETGIWYDNSLIAAKTFGLLAIEVFTDALSYGYYANSRGVWPTGQHFKVDKRVHIIPAQYRGI